MIARAAILERIRTASPDFSWDRGWMAQDARGRGAHAGQKHSLTLVFAAKGAYPARADKKGAAKCKVSCCKSISVLMQLLHAFRSFEYLRMVIMKIRARTQP